MSFCQKCGSYIYSNSNHECKEYTVDVEDYGEMSAYGSNIEEALKNIAEKYNDEGDLIDNEVNVYYQDKTYVLSAEIDVKYRVKEIGE